MGAESLAYADVVSHYAWRSTFLTRWKRFGSMFIRGELCDPRPKSIIAYEVAKQTHGPLEASHDDTTWNVSRYDATSKRSVQVNSPEFETIKTSF